jgi:hypothetical protein
VAWSTTGSPARRVPGTDRYFALKALPQKAEAVSNVTFRPRNISAKSFFENRFFGPLSSRKPKSRVPHLVMSQAYL